MDHNLNTVARNMTDREQLLTVNQAAMRLGLRPSTIRRWVLLRKVTIVNVGRAVRIPGREIERLIDEGTIPAAPDAR